MKVWILQTGEPLHCDGGSPRPMRAVNLANSLVLRGHEVVLWSSAFFHQEKRHRCREFQSLVVSAKLTINLIPSRGYTRNIGIGRLFDHAQLARNLSRLLNSGTFEPPDIAFVGYPPIETAAVMLRWLRMRGVPSVIDVKDQWPSLFLEPFPNAMRPLVRMALAPYFYFARRALRDATAFCSMSRGYLEWMSAFSGRSLREDDMVIPLTAPSLTVSPNDLVSANDWWAERGVSRSNKRRFSFVGSLSPAFDFSLIRDVAARFQNEGVDCQFVICGDGGAAHEIRTMMEGLSNVIFPGWIDAPKIEALALCSSGSLAPYKNTSNFIYNVPNKIFDSFSHCLPIVTTLTGEVRRLLEAEKTGFYVDTLQGAYEIMIRLLNDDAFRSEVAERAGNLYRRKFSCEEVYCGLAINLEKLGKVSNDKLMERDRYEGRAQISANSADPQLRQGAGDTDLMIRAPYLFFESLLNDRLLPTSLVLEIGAGTGAFTGVLLRSGANVCATDISPRSLQVLEGCYQGMGRLKTQVADMECLPFPDETFDMVTSAGSLSYGDNGVVMNEIYRVLKRGGLFLCVDSLNHNPIYRFNRWLHYLRGNRTKSTLIRMPTISLIERYGARFGATEVQYFGTVSWLMPLIAPVFGKERAARVSDWADRVSRVRKSAFKFVMIARKTRNEPT